MVENKTELKNLFINMMESTANSLQNDVVYQKDIDELGELKVQWKICGLDGYQIFERDNYSFKFGEILKDPDISLIIDDEELALKFLNGEHMGFNYIFHRNYRGKFEVNYETGPIENREKKLFLVAKIYHESFKHPISLLKIPPLRKGRKGSSTDEEYGSYIPINQSLGTYENQIIPYKVFKHFIEQASNVVMVNNCYCRLAHHCKNHDISIGCMYMGDETLKIKIDDKKKRVTKEEALERVRLAIDNGLIPILGRSIGEAAGQGVVDKGHFLSCCFCCSCCCINGTMITNGPNTPIFYKRMKGLSISVNQAVCTGCGKCLEVCVFKGRKIIDGKAQVDLERCLGCGRCENICTTGATTIKIDDMSFVDEIITKIEKYVDVRDQASLEQ